MSDQITIAMVDTYKSGLTMLAQQLQSKLIGRVRTESELGERVGFDQTGAVRARKKTVRNGDTKYINSPHKKRWVTMEDFEIADLMDKFDVIKILNQPGGQYAKAFVGALNRERDTSIIAAALGTAYTGKKGLTATALPAAQKIADGGTGFTYAKVESAMDILAGGNAVDPDSELTIAWTRKQEKEFLQNTEVKSIDYNTQKVLIKGGMGDAPFYGFTYVRLEDWTDEEDVTNKIIPATAGIRSCVAWVKDGLLLNESMGTDVLVDRMPGKGQSTQIWAGSSFGATRMQESMVVQIDVVE